jgi:heme/copper-type cytochrome/quinol oxidase subunit 2
MRSVAVILSLLLFLSACAEGADDVAVTTTVPAADAGASTTSTSPVETTTTMPTTTTTVATTTTIVGTLIRVVVQAGEVTVNGPTSVPVGEQVTIRIRSDVEDVVELSDSDVSMEVGPGSRTDVAFTADEPGTFAVVMQESGTTLFDLEVTE